TNALLTTGGILAMTVAGVPACVVALSSVHGTNGTFSIDATGAWAYTADSAFDNLNVGQSVSDQFAVAAADGTTTFVKVTIKGTRAEERRGGDEGVGSETNARRRTGGRV